MDFEGLVWIALIVFYFLTRALGKKGGKRPAGRPEANRERRPAAPLPSSSPSPRGELDDALQEIRQALGFPEQPRAPQKAEPAPPPPRREPAGIPPQSIPARVPSLFESRRTSEPLEKPLERPKLYVPPIKRRAPLRAKPPTPTPRRRPTRQAARQDASFKEKGALRKVGLRPRTGRPKSLQVIKTDSSPEGKHLPRILGKLRRQSSLRDAFVMKEILDRPLSLRGRGPRR